MARLRFTRRPPWDDEGAQVVEHDSDSESPSDWDPDDPPTLRYAKEALAKPRDVLLLIRREPAALKLKQKAPPTQKARLKRVTDPAAWKPGQEIVGGGFASLPHALLRSEAWAALDLASRDMYVFMAGKLNGDNNGKISATMVELEKYGWKTAAVRANAIRRLIKSGFVSQTREASRARPAWYRLAGVRQKDPAK